MPKLIDPMSLGSGRVRLFGAVQRAQAALADVAQLGDDDFSVREEATRSLIAMGKPAVGYALLIRGMTRAEKILTDGRPWGTELLRCWRAAIDRYCERVGDHHEDDEGAPRYDESAAR